MIAIDTNVILYAIDRRDLRKRAAVAACIEVGVDQLYTEDMGSPRQLDSVQLINPF